MQILLARVLAVILALQPWAFGMFAAPRANKNNAASLSSPAQDQQTILENLRSVTQVQNSTRETGLAPTITAHLETPIFTLDSSFLIVAREAFQADTLARFSRWNE